MHIPWRIAVPAVGIGLTVGIWTAVAGAGASSAPGVVDRQHPPPIPAIVNADGSLNLKVVESIPVMGANGQLHKPTQAEILGTLGMTPAQVHAMTPAERAQAHAEFGP